MALKRDIIQLDIVIGDDGARAKLAKMTEKASELREQIKGVKREHVIYVKSAKDLVHVENDIKKTTTATKLHKEELTSLRAEHAVLKKQIKESANADEALIVKEKELTKAIKVKNAQIKLEESYLKSLERKQAKYIATMKKYKSGSEEYKKATAALKLLENEIDTARRKFDVFKMTPRELAKELRHLKAVQKNMVPGTAQWDKFDKRIQVVNGRIKELSVNSKIAAKAQLTLKQKISKGADFFNKYAASLVSIVAALGGLIFSVKNAISMFNEFEQAEADLSALTGLTGDKLKYLTDSSREMSTSMTEDGIRIKNSAKDIVDAMGVVGSQRPELLKNAKALEAVTKDALILASASDGKLAPATIAVTSALNNFELAAKDSRRVINALAAGSKEGAADVPKLTKVFDKAGTSAKLMGMSVEDLIGIAEAVAPKFNDMSVAGNSLDKIFLKMKDTGIGYTDGVFDINDALDELRERISNGEKVTKLFGVEHAKMVEVLLAEQGEINRYTKAVTGSNVAIEQAIVKTSTNAAKLEQAKNKAAENAMVLGEQLAPALTFSTNAFSYLLKVLVTIIKNWDTFKKVLIVGIATITAYTIATKGATLATKLGERALMLYWKAQEFVNKSMKKTPWGLIIAGATAVIGLLIAFRDRMSESNKSIREFNKQLVKEKAELNNVFIALKKAGKGTEARKELIDQINKEYGKYLPNLLTEKSSLQEIEQAQKLANAALERNLALKMRSKAEQEAYNKAIQTRADVTSAIVELITASNKHITKQATDELNNLLNESIKIGKISEQKFQEYAKNYGATTDFLQQLFRDNINAVIQAEKEKNTELTNIQAAFSGYMHNELDKTYQDEINALEVKYKTGLLNEEDYQKQLMEIKLRYGKMDAFGGKGDNSSDNNSNNSEDNTYNGGGAGKTQNDTEAIKKLIQSMNLELIEDERKKAEKEIEIWYGTERKKIEISKTSAKLKNTALESLHDLHNKKLIDLDESYRQKSLEVFDNVNEFLKNKHQELLDAKLSDDNREIASISEKYNKEIELLNEQLAKKNELYDGFLTQKNELEKLRDEEISSYKLEKLQEHNDKVNEVMKEYNLLTDEDSMQEELAKLKSYYDEKLITDENYEKAKAAIIKQYAEKQRNDEKQAYLDKIKLYQDSINKYNAGIQIMGDFFQAEKEDELATAGDSEEKKKNIMKKYADKEFAVKSASIIANTAMAVTQALAQLGPIAGAIMSGVIITTGAIQLSKANTEWSKVKQLAKGKYPVYGADDGRLYNANYKNKLGTGIINQPTLVAEEPEMVIDHKTLYSPKRDKYNMTVMDHAAAITALKFPIVPQRASGKYDNINPTSNNVETQTNNSDELFKQLIAEIQGLRADVQNQKTLLKAYIVLSELEAKQLEMDDAIENANI